MFKFIPEKLSLELRENEIHYKELVPRKYTLTHSDDNEELLLTIGKDYAYNKANEVDDAVLAEWVMEGDEYILNVYIDVDGDMGSTDAENRNRMFREKLPLALKAIVYGDRKFLSKHELLKDAPVIVNFKSELPEYNKVERWGVISDYIYEGEQQRSNFRQKDPEVTSHLISPPYPWPSPGPSPWPGPGPGPFPPSEPTKGKNAIIERALINTLSSYIKSEIYVAFGRNTYYCLAEADILRARTIRTYGPCSEEYEVVVGLRVGRRPPRNYNIRITFVINENSIRVRDVDRPRPRPRPRE